MSNELYLKSAIPEPARPGLNMARFNWTTWPLFQFPSAPMSLDYVHKAATCTRAKKHRRKILTHASTQTAVLLFNGYQEKLVTGNDPDVTWNWLDEEKMWFVPPQPSCDVLISCALATAHARVVRQKSIFRGRISIITLMPLFNTICSVSGCSQLLSLHINFKKCAFPSCIQTFRIIIVICVLPPLLSSNQNMEEANSKKIWRSET